MQAPTRVHIREHKLDRGSKEGYGARFNCRLGLEKNPARFQGIDTLESGAPIPSLRNEEIFHELQYGWDHSIRTEWLVDFIYVHALNAVGESYQRNACHGFLLLIFGTILFPYSSNLIDGALAQVILQVVGGHSYVEAVLAKTIRSLDYVREVRRGTMRGAPHPLQIWLLAHISPFCSSHPFSCITDECSLIIRLLHVFRPSDRDYTDWRQFMEGLTPTQFLWAASWNPGGPMTIGCPSAIGLPLISHLGSILIFPGRVIRQLGGLQDIPVEADRTPPLTWADTTVSLPDRFLRVREIRLLWSTRIVREHPVDEEWTFSTTTAEERDRLRCELVDIRSELTDHRELQSELPQTHARIASLDREITHLSAMLDRARAKACKNRASSSFTLPPERRPPVDLNLVIPPIYVTDCEDIAFSTMTHAPAVDPISNPLPPPPAPTMVPLPQAAFLSMDSTMHALPPLAIPPQLQIYTVPPPTVPPVTMAQAPISTMDHFPFQAPQPQYRFCAEMPPTLLDLSMSEMKENQTFDAYATKWRGKAAKHIPPITERQQVQLFHSMLRGAYYSHLLAHTSSFSELIEVGKKLDVGVKLGRIEGPSKKKDGESSKKQTAGTSRKGKDATIGTVNPGRQNPQ
ncbi:hypothetical protein CRG98_028521 [Punica granatum]|uniref:DUF7745 domain-containing protein n=1 Tax=Punica granatum TaxID=22663 RepID=A0A2I0J4D3_PUNGR|nr:hypothetical protein CRG98_028521 [Punica granatum]